MGDAENIDVNPKFDANEKSATMSVRERMRAEKEKRTQATSVTQTDDYEDSSNTSQQVEDEQQVDDVVEEDDNIQDGEAEDNSKPKFTLGKNSIWIILAIVAALIFVGYIVFSKSKGNDANPDTGLTEDDAVVDDDTPIGAGDTMDPNSVITAAQYTQEEIDALTAAGYSNDDINTMMANGTVAEDAIKEANLMRDAYTRMADVPLYDVASDAYKQQISQTWLTLPKRTDIDTWKWQGPEYIVEKNLDYEKLEVHGMQLIIKIYLDDSEHKTWFYKIVTPDEWMKLNDRGNVVVDYTYVTHLVGNDYGTAVEDTNIEDSYIIDATLNIIDSEDNTDLNGIDEQAVDGSGTQNYRGDGSVSF